MDKVKIITHLYAVWKNGDKFTVRFLRTGTHLFDGWAWKGDYLVNIKQGSKVAWIR